MCSDLPPGQYDVTLRMYDGVGGVKAFPLKVEIKSERKSGGDAIWQKVVGDFESSNDSDNDGVTDSADAFPNDPAASVDSDGDGKPDYWNEGYSANDSTSSPQLVLDNDDDNDGIEDHLDEFPLEATTDPLDQLIDPNGDYDGDGVINAEDHFPTNSAEWMDLDFDGIADNADDDDDGDGVLDAVDAFPNNPFETLDSDGDGVGDFVDAEPNSASVQSLTISDALLGVEDANLRACLDQKTQGMSLANELTELSCNDPPEEIYSIQGLSAFYKIKTIYLGRGLPCPWSRLPGCMS